MSEPPELPAATAARKQTQRRVRISLTTLVAVVTLATGVLTLRDQLFPKADNREPSVAVVPRESGEVPRFDGIAGHLAESRALLDFLDQHDDDTVYLEVGFPTLASGPVSGDNVVAEDAPDGRTVVKEVALMTDCPPELSATDKNPTPADGCMGTSLDIRDSETDDSGTFFQHGVPVIKGYFLVDVTGGLHMGLSLIFLRPLTFEQATQQ